MSKLENRFIIKEYIASGTFGSVFKALDTKHDKIVAIKRIQKLGDLESREVTVLLTLRDCPNIINLKKLIYTFRIVNDKKIIVQNLVMDYMENNLCLFISKNIKEKIFLKFDKCILYLYQILKAVEYYNRFGIVHRDLKPDNILFHNDFIKICDFGSAKVLNEEGNNCPYICSTYYRPPELFFGLSNYNLNLDIWSIGCIFYEIIMNEIMFKGEKEYLQLIKIFSEWRGITKNDIEYFTEKMKRMKSMNHILNRLPYKNHKIDEKLFKKKLEKNVQLTKYQIDIIYDLLLKMLVINPDLRYSAKELLNEEVFKKF